jgi:hypothetical protein
MKKALTFLLVMFTHLVFAQNTKRFEFRNITGQILTSENRPAQKYMVMYYPIELGSFTNDSGKFNVNVPIGVPVLLKISDGKNPAFFYKVNPEDKAIAIKLDEKMNTASKVLLAEWDKDKAKNEFLARSIYDNSRYQDFLRRQEGSKNEVDHDIVISSSPVQLPVKNEANRVYAIYECEVKPPHMNKGLLFPDFVKANLVYPKIAKENNIQGKAFVSAIIEPDGSLSNISIPRKLSPECDKEAIRLVKLFKWSPGLVGGKKVRTALNEFVTFKL